MSTSERGPLYEAFGSRPLIPEDSIDYYIYPYDIASSQDAQMKRLTEINEDARHLFSELFQDYVWQHDGLELGLRQEEARCSLYGRLRFGDSMDDEWAAVYALRTLSERFPDVWVRVFDGDGEFLLIEAADALPKWLNPETAENRVWIHGGSLIIVPDSKKSSNNGNVSSQLEALEVYDALRWLSEHEHELLHAKTIEKEAFFRLRNYPKQIKDNMHRAVAIVPRKVACILHETPQTISTVVEAFYLRDPISLRALTRPLTKTDLLPPQDLVRTSVLFNKTGYAQLKYQRFMAPAGVEKTFLDFAGPSDAAQAELGIKITCGFQMLITDSGGRNDRSALRVREALLKLDAPEANLPSHDEISRWGEGEDDESWLDIDFGGLDKELSAGISGDPNADPAAFGDPAIRDNLRRLVTRFRGLLEESSDGEDGGMEEGGEEEEEDDDDDDEEQGIDGDENEGTDSNDSSDGKGSDGKSQGEDDFTRMMREMLGMPPEVMRELMGRASPADPL